MSISTKAPTRESLETDLTAATEAVTAAERKLAAVSADGKPAKPAMSQLEDAVAECDRLRLGLDEVDRREVNASAEAADQAQHEQLAQLYDFSADYLPKVASLLDARKRLAAQEEQLAGYIRQAPARLKRLRGPGPGVERVRVDGISSIRGFSETELDVTAIGAVSLPLAALPLKFPEGLTADTCVQAAARCREMATAERAGESIAITGSQISAERAAQRQQKREASKAERAKAKSARITASRPATKPIEPEQSIVEKLATQDDLKNRRLVG